MGDAGATKLPPAIKKVSSYVEASKPLKIIPGLSDVVDSIKKTAVETKQKIKVELDAEEFEMLTKLMEIKKHYGNSEEVFNVIKVAQNLPKRERTKTLEDYKREMFGKETEEQKRERERIMDTDHKVDEHIVETKTHVKQERNQTYALQKNATRMINEYNAADKAIENMALKQIGFLGEPEKVEEKKLESMFMINQLISSGLLQPTLDFNHKYDELVQTLKSRNPRAEIAYGPNGEQPMGGSQAVGSGYGLTLPMPAKGPFNSQPSPTNVAKPLPKYLPLWQMNHLTKEEQRQARM